VKLSRDPSEWMHVHFSNVSELSMLFLEATCDLATVGAELNRIRGEHNAARLQANKNAVWVCDLREALEQIADVLDEAWERTKDPQVLACRHLALMALEDPDEKTE